MTPPPRIALDISEGFDTRLKQWFPPNPAQRSMYKFSLVLSGSCRVHLLSPVLPTPCLARTPGPPTHLGQSVNTNRDFPPGPSRTHCICSWPTSARMPCLTGLPVLGSISPSQICFSSFGLGICNHLSGGLRLSLQTSSDLAHSLQKASGSWCPGPAWPAQERVQGKCHPEVSL